MTAGELIRRELLAGTSQLALAKRLAGSDNDADPEVKRWRFVVRRAARGAEPQEAKMPRIAEVFGIPVTKLDRPQRDAARASVDGRLEALAANDAAILANQQSAIATQESLRDELQSIREALDILLDGARTRPRRRSGR